MEGDSELEGRLEVCFSQRWGTVSSDGWTQTNTKVICNHLGYDTVKGKKNTLNLIYLMKQHVVAINLFEIAKCL